MLDPEKVLRVRGELLGWPTELSGRGTRGRSSSSCLPTSPEAFKYFSNPSIHSGGHQMNIIPTSGLSYFRVPEMPTVTGDSRSCPMCHLFQCGSFSVKACSIKKRSDVPPEVGEQGTGSNLLSQLLVPCAQRSVGTALYRSTP